MWRKLACLGVLLVGMPLLGAARKITANCAVSTSNWIQVSNPSNVNQTVSIEMRAYGTGQLVMVNGSMGSDVSKTNKNNSLECNSAVTECWLNNVGEKDASGNPLPQKKKVLAPGESMTVSFGSNWSTSFSRNYGLTVTIEVDEPQGYLVASWTTTYGSSATMGTFPINGGRPF